MIPRFDVGDIVLCYRRGWQQRVVDGLWPIDVIKDLPKGPAEAYGVPRYQCIDHYPSQDDDYYIMKRPDSFRLAVGDSVVFDLNKAELNSSNRSRLPHTWIKGTVVSVDITGIEYYAAYECAFKNNRKEYSCHVVKDDDKHIAKSDANPRTRLFDSIEQACGREHLIYLVDTFNIDVTTFRNLVISKALQHTNFHALSWLQCDCNNDVMDIKDVSGNNLLHMIASTSHAVRFIREVGIISFDKGKHDAENELNMFDLFNLTSLNNNGKSWLQILVRREDVKAFDAARSPIYELAWYLYSKVLFKDEHLCLLEESIKRVKSRESRVVMQFIFDSFMSFRGLLQQYRTLAFLTCKSQHDLLQEEFMSGFQGEDASHHAAVLARFYLDWRGYKRQVISSPFIGLASRGFDIFSHFYKANPQIILHETYCVLPDEDQNEYIQPELAISSKKCSTYEHIDVNVVLACIIGEEGSGSGFRTCDHNFYLHSLLKHTVSCDPKECPSWLSHMKELITRRVEMLPRSQDCFKHKIRILGDSANLEGRLKVLDLLLQGQPHVRLNALEMLRHRRCGMLRFMANMGMLMLDSNASSNRLFVKHTSELRFLKESRIPPGTSTRSFLCFAAVEYDDLQSLEWLCQAGGVPINTCDGWNLLHYSAFLGRMEIISFLHTQRARKNLTNEVCCRKPY
ncbi:hypothetical protein ACHAWF_015404 [Thalassiosira exigua]